jgi:hypothetical protein
MPDHPGAPLQLPLFQNDDPLKIFESRSRVIPCNGV